MVQGWGGGTKAPLVISPLGKFSISWKYLLELFNHIITWRHNERDGVSNHQPHHCSFNRLFKRRSKKTSKLRVTGLCAGNSPVAGEFPAQMASNAEIFSIWWRHHVTQVSLQLSCCDICQIRMWYSIDDQRFCNLKKNIENSGVWELAWQSPSIITPWDLSMQSDGHVQVSYVRHWYHEVLTHWDSGKKAAILQTTFSNIFLWIKFIYFYSSSMGICL